MLYNILSIDDEKINHEIIQETLPSYNVEVAMDADEAMELLSNKDIDLILLDIMMPNSDGIELCKRIKHNPKTSHIPILFITANTEDAYIQKAFEAGGIDFIKKPVNAVDIQQRVQLHLKDRVIFTIDNEHFFNAKTQTLYKNNIQVPLSNNEKKLLALFMHNIGQTIDVAKIANSIFNNSSYEYKNKTIRNLISSLRSKLPEESIVSIYGIGYRFNLQDKI